MKTYIEIIDLTREVTDREYAYFYEWYTCNDIAGLINAIARKHGTDIKDVRAFIHTKKSFEARRDEFYKNLKD